MDAATEKPPPPEDPPKEHIVPIVIEGDEPPKPSSPSTADLPSESNMCNMVKQINISGDGDGDGETNGLDEIATESETTVELPARLLPAHNWPERIIIVYDCGCDADDDGSFKVDGEKFVANDVVKRGLKFFLNHKNDMDERHEFALVGLTDDGAIWLKDFTSNIRQFYSVIDNVSLISTDSGDFSLNALFDLISDNINVGHLGNDLNETPPFIYRILFTYCRSSLITFGNLNTCRDLLDSPYFTFDVLITHDNPDANNNGAKNIEFLQKIDSKGYNYVFPVGRSARDLHLATAKLLGHPLQRPRQIISNYKIDLDEE